MRIGKREAMEILKDKKKLQYERRDHFWYNRTAPAGQQVCEAYSENTPKITGEKASNIIKSLMTTKGWKFFYVDEEDLLVATQYSYGDYLFWLSEKSEDYGEYAFGY